MNWIENPGPCSSPTQRRARIRLLTRLVLRDQSLGDIQSRGVRVEWVGEYMEGGFGSFLVFVMNTSRCVVQQPGLEIIDKLNDRIR